MTNAALAAEHAPDVRREIKFVGHAMNYDHLKSWLNCHRDRFVEPYPARQVNSVYFDGIDYPAFAQNLAGVSERSKVRYRWYGETLFPQSGALEVKRKRNMFGWKLRFDINEPGWDESARWIDIVASIRRQLPTDGRLWLDQSPFPMIINSYRREYFLSSDGALRATIDTRQRVFDQRFAARPNVGTSAPLDDTVVVEFKFAREHWLQASRMVQGFPLRIGRHSKYMNGMRAVGFVQG